MKDDDNDLPMGAYTVPIGESCGTTKGYIWKAYKIILPEEEVNTENKSI